MRVRISSRQRRRRHLCSQRSRLEALAKRESSGMGLNKVSSVGRSLLSEQSSGPIIELRPDELLLHTAGKSITRCHNREMSLVVRR